MVRSVIVATVLGLAPSVGALSLAPPLRAHAAVCVRTPAIAARTTCLTCLDEFLPDADLLEAGASGEAAEMLNALVFFFALSFSAKFFSPSLEASFEDEELDEGAADQGTAGFGWLQADMRVPLPSWEELQQACHLVGTHNGRYMYLCATNAVAVEQELDDCKVSQDFTRYYGGKTVFVCAGGEAEVKRQS